MSAVLGVDPGVSGGIAVLGRNGAVLYCKGVRGDMTEKALSNMVGDAVEVLRAAGGGPAFVEKVGFIKGDGGKGSFTFGGVYKFVLGCLHTRDLIVVNVYPQAWQSRMECLTGGNKNISKRKAQELWPGTKWTHAIADAALIAEYGRRVTQMREPLEDDPLA